MKPVHLAYLCIVLTSTALLAQTNPVSLNQPPVRVSSAPGGLSLTASQTSEGGAGIRHFSALPAGFEENVGQFPSSARFVAHLHGYSVYFSRSEMLLVFRSKGKNGKGAEVVHIVLAGSNGGAEPQGVEPLAGVANYYLGDDPAAWKTGVHRFRQVRYQDVYSGVDLVSYGNRTNF